MKTIITYLFVCSFSVLMAGVGKDTLQLDEVLKVDKATTNAPVYESPFTDLKYKQGERLSDVLGEYSSVYIKNYGSGGLASLAIRGTSASQSEIQWNGVKLNLPSLGQVDLALFLVGTQDELQLVRTGYHGTIGGTLNMVNDAMNDSGYYAGLSLRAGSFGTYDASIDTRYSNRKFFGASKFNYLASQNNFLYRNDFIEGNPSVKQTNAATRQLSFLQQFGCHLNRSNDLEFLIWLNDANRQLPPVESQSNGKESEDDYSLRTMANWKGGYNALRLKLTAAYLEDKLRYKNPNALIDETSKMHAQRNSFSIAYLFPFRLSLNAELNYDHEWVNIADYGNIKSRNTVGLRAYADYYAGNHFKLHAGFREDLVDKKLSAFAPEFAFNYFHALPKAHKISAGLIASRNFRFPTLNDLYWVPGGNASLKQESSINGEIQLKYAYKKIVEVSVSNFYLYVNNWIQWVPQASVWTPLNYKRVFSKGLEATLHLSNADEGRLNKFIVHFNASYSFTKTTNLDAASTFDESKGKQLIYVPLHNLFAGVQLEYYKFYLRCTNNYTGMVYTSTDNSAFLKDYLITNVEAGKNFTIKNVELGFSFRVNNVANVQYQVVAQRPMPGRNYEGVFRFKFFS